jgi:2-phosphosulfolactate phosphatase
VRDLGRCGQNVMVLEHYRRQRGFDIRLEWGLTGLRTLLPELATVVIVDVLRFTTAVESAVTAGCTVFPYRWQDPSAAAFAAAKGAVLADSSDRAGPSLSPVAMSAQPQGSSIVLPSPNGGSCAAEAAETGRLVVAGCLRNAAAVADALAAAPRPIGVIAAGETRDDGSLRPAIEDHLGAGAILALLAGERSPEAETAAAMWRAIGDDANRLLADCYSGRSLAQRGCGPDVTWAGAVNVSTALPQLIDGRFQASPQLAS